MITGGPSQEESSEPCMVQAALDKRYRSELSAWVESAAPAGRAVHQEAQRRINAYLEEPAEQRKLINLSALSLSTLPPLPDDLIELDVSENKLTALPQDLPQGLQTLAVSYNKLTALPGLLPQSLKSLSVTGTRLDAKTLVALMRTNTSITKLDVDMLSIDAGSRQELHPELINNKNHPARLADAAVTLDLLTRLALTTSDQTGALIKRDATPTAGLIPRTQRRD